jgi:radical SAM protein with 4Fe4S-binding SPASM domain
MPWVFSNGMLLTDNLIRTIVKEELISLHGFSVDGITPATVERMRLNAKLEVIRENIATLIRIRREEGKDEPMVIIRYALMRSNIEELPEAVRQWGEIGVERIDCNYLSICNEIDQQESLYFHQDLMQQVFQQCRTLSLRYPRLTLNLPPTIRQEQQFLKNPKTCTAPWNFIRVETDGRILPCYKSWGVISMGNIFDNNGGSIRNIWNNSHYQALRRTVNIDGPQKYYGYCAECPIRFGQGELSAHLDATWLENIDSDPATKAKLIDHRTRERKRP